MFVNLIKIASVRMATMINTCSYIANLMSPKYDHMRPTKLSKNNFAARRFNNSTLRRSLHKTFRALSVSRNLEMIHKINGSRDFKIFIKIHSAVRLKPNGRMTHKKNNSKFSRVICRVI